jgi:hypothetical protein
MNSSTKNYMETKQNTMGCGRLGNRVTSLESVQWGGGGGYLDEENVQ